MNVFGVLFSLLFILYKVYGFSMIKELNGVIYVGGRNSLSAYTSDGENLKLLVTQRYSWPVSIMNGSDIGFKSPFQRWPLKFTNNIVSFIFDACLNWKQEHQDESVRSTFLDYHHWQYHTPSGDWLTMNFSCMNSFIKSVEMLTNDTLWVCGTFGAFPRAFSVNKENLTFIKFEDVNMMSCARYEDEPMATYRDRLNNLYVASGWGLYRPDKTKSDIPDNNSTMLYADWRLYRNLFTLPSSMAWVLSSDVNFIDVVSETDTHLYFFGHEINSQYGLNNQEDRHAWQSFMLRICKRDLGFKYVPNENKRKLTNMINIEYYRFTANGSDYPISLLPDITMSESWYRDTVHLPTKHFLNPLKVNFGCYIGRRPRAISDNHHWGKTNVVYINKLADVVFNPLRTIKYHTKNNNEFFGCSNESHSQIPLIGIFNNPGLFETQVRPVGALCQLQMNSNIFHEIGSSKKPYHKSNLLSVTNAYEEIMALSLTTVSNFYSRTLHRLNGFSLDPYWNQGVLLGKPPSSFLPLLDELGKCHNQSFYNQISKTKFLQFQNFSNTAWPNELPNRLNSITSSICQFSAVELYSFNATFLVPGVEFKKIFILQDNYTNYHMNKLLDEDDEQQLMRLKQSPLIIAIILSSSGVLYRVVICDFDSASENNGIDKTKDVWYNWCIFRHTDQPYLYRQYAPMEKRKYGESYQYRASSLLMEQQVVKKEDSNNFPNNRDPQLDVVKDVLKQGDNLHVVTGSNMYSINLKIKCSSYKRCIHCASDPFCMWNISASNCINYNNREFRNRNPLFVQDVLDRGFQCSIAIKSKYLVIESSNILLLNCSNSDFWRGDIKWTINGETVNIDESIHMFRDNKMMIISNYSLDQHGDNISCFGVKNDHDKLFSGKEYSWIMESTNILLNNYKIEPIIIFKQKFTWEGISVTFVFTSIIMSILWMIFWKLKKIIKNNNFKLKIKGLTNKSQITTQGILKILPIRKDAWSSA